MKFSKWHGLGNDFIFVNGFSEFIQDFRQTAIQACDRHFGIGADGLVVALPSHKADFRMRIFNSDGSEAEMCGNATRCFAQFLHEQKLTEKTTLTIETLAGIVHAELCENGLVKVNLGEPRLKRAEIPVSGKPDDTAVNVPLEVDGTTYQVTCVSTGVPHCVIFVDTFDNLDVAGLGRQIEHHPFFPQKTNVEFIKIINKNEMIMKVWERGAGITLACGTGASAALVAAVLNGKTERHATIHLDGGDLVIDWHEHVFMSGPALEVFKGVMSTPALL